MLRLDDWLDATSYQTLTWRVLIVLVNEYHQKTPVMKSYTSEETYHKLLSNFPYDTSVSMSQNFVSSYDTGTLGSKMMFFRLTTTCSDAGVGKRLAAGLYKHTRRDCVSTINRMHEITEPKLVCLDLHSTHTDQIHHGNFLQN